MFLSVLTFYLCVMLPTFNNPLLVLSPPMFGAIYELLGLCMLPIVILCEDMVPTPEAVLAKYS